MGGGQESGFGNRDSGLLAFGVEPVELSLRREAIDDAAERQLIKMFATRRSDPIADCRLPTPVMAIYCVNWGFRLPTRGMDAPVRDEIASEFGPWLTQLQFQGEARREGRVFSEFGIVYVPDPYTAR